jgi:O-antigen/teichoic acid export membrane protein
MSAGTRFLPGAAGSVGTAIALQASLLASGIVVARALGPEGRGYVALLAALPSVLCQLGGLGFSLGVSYYVSRERISSQHALSLIAKAVAIQIGLLTVIHAGLLVLLLRDDPKWAQVAGVISLASVLGSFTGEYGLLIFQGQGKFGTFNILRLAPTLAYAIFVVILFGLGQRSVSVVVGASVATGLAFGLLTLALAARSRVPEEKESDLRFGQVAKFGLRSFLGATSPLESFRLDQLFVGLVLSPVALGYYAVGAAVSNFPRFVAQSLGFVASPTVASELSSEVQWMRVRQFVVLTSAVSVAIGVGLVSAAPVLVPLVFGTSFHRAVGVSQILVANGVIVGVRRVLTDAMRGLGRPAVGAVAEVVGLVALVPLIIGLGRVWGLDGAAVAVTLSSGLGLIVIALLSLRMRREDRHRTAIATHAPVAFGK